MASFSLNMASEPLLLYSSASLGCPRRPFAPGPRHNPETPSMLGAVARKDPVKYRDPRRDFCPKPSSRQTRPHIDHSDRRRHTDDDIQHCGGSIGTKRCQKSDECYFHGLAVFQRDGQRLLPRLLHSVVRLLWHFFVSGFVARVCPRAEYEAAFWQ